MHGRRTGRDGRRDDEVPNGHCHGGVYKLAAVEKPDGTIATQYKPEKSRAQKGTFYGLPVVRGVVAFVESLSIGMGTLTESAKLAGEEIDEEPSKFEKWLAAKLGKSVESVIIGFAVVIAVCLAVGLFFVLPTLLGSLILGGSEVASVWKSLTEGLVRLLIFLGYIVLCSRVKDVRRVFMYHGAEHKTIACYEAEEPLTPENAMKHSRLHPRCGTNYLFLVMAVSILFFAAVGWNANFLVRLASRIIFLPLVAGISYEVLRFAAKHDNLLTRIIRAPGMGLQYITTKEPTPDMLEVAITAFELAMDPEGFAAKQAAAETKEGETAAAETATAKSTSSVSRPDHADSRKGTKVPPASSPLSSAAMPSSSDVRRERNRSGVKSRRSIMSGCRNISPGPG